MLSLFFFFNDTATTEIYTLSLHDALPICSVRHARHTATRKGPAGTMNAMDSPVAQTESPYEIIRRLEGLIDRKSTRLNSSHGYISYAVFCLKKKKQHNNDITHKLKLHTIT